MGKYTNYGEPTREQYAEMDSRLAIAVQAAASNVYLTSKAEIVDYYQDTYGKSWKQKIVHDLASITGMKPKNLERRFDPSRRDNPEKRNAGQYEKLGQLLPPIGKKTPKGGYKVSMTGYVKISDNWKKLNIKSVSVKGKAADRLTHDPAYADIFDSYFNDAGMTDEYDIGGLHVEAVE